jgi:hypothetical protein
MVLPSNAADARFQAATLTFAMLRFENESAHESHASHPENRRLGYDDFIFLPSWNSIKREDVVTFLAGLPSPALIFPTTTRGAASLLLLNELAGEREKWGRKTLDNQLAGINEMASQFSPALSDESNVLLQVSGETHLLSLSVLRLWSQQFSAPLGWSIGESRDDPRAPARIRLHASDGRVNPEWMAFAPWHRPVP